MPIITLIIAIVFNLADHYQLEGRWKLHEAEAFLNILTSENFRLGTEVQQREISDTFDFALENTYYTFKGDSVFFTDTGARETINYKNGKWLLQNDTLMIFESGKFHVHKFLIESLNRDELIMRIVFPTGEVSLSNMKFVKVE
ncbi:lipocalin family protein [Algoriphagus namhaensis]